MATLKRKRNSTRTTPSKRPKYAEPSQSEPDGQSQDSQDDWWEIDEIVDEWLQGKQRVYQVKWIGTDPATGEAYPPSPVTEVTDAALKAWEEEKARTGFVVKNRANRRGKGKGKGRGRTKELQLGQQSSRRNRRRVVDSSPEPSTAPSSALPVEHSTTIRESTTLVEPSRATTNRQSPRISIPARGSSFEPDAFEPVSNLSPSRAATPPSSIHESDLESSQIFAAPQINSTGIIPDSQSSAGEADFEPVTQGTVESTEVSQEEGIIEDSGLLELIEEAAARATSPAASIPETIAETTADTQSQQQGIEIPDTLETVESSSQVSQAPAESQEFADQNAYDTSSGVCGTSGEINLRVEAGVTQASLAEQSAAEENAQFPYHSQHPLHHPDPPQQPVNQAAKSASESAIIISSGATDVDTSCSTVSPPVQVEGGIIIAGGQAATNPDLPPTPNQLVIVVPEASTQIHNHESDWFNATVPPDNTSASSPPVPQTQRLQDVTTSNAPQTALLSQDAAAERVLCRDFALPATLASLTGHCTESHHQNAQVIAIEADFSTHDESTESAPSAESVRPTIEKEHIADRASSESRHDSSQETPQRRLGSPAPSSSPILQPPSHSLGTLDSRLPPRPSTPIPTSSISIMASRDFGAEIEAELKEMLAKRQAENPFTPTRRIFRRSYDHTSAASEASPAPITSARRLLRTQASPSAAAADGTRSPSTVPDRSPASQMPTSLRTVAVADSGAAPTANDLPTEQESSTSVPQQESANVEIVVTDHEPEVALDIPATESTDQELSDADDEDSDSYLEDDLQLEQEEHIVPLPIDGRQHDTYTAYIQQKKDHLERFLNDPRDVASLQEVEAILSHMRAIETHLDLVFAEADEDEENTATQIEFAAQFGLENSAKFRFLHSLFHQLRDQNKHLVLVTEQDDDRLFNILDTFCRAKFINYSMPTKGRYADQMYVEGTLSVTIFPINTSPIIRAPDLIICLDGVQEASKIRQQSWATSPDRDAVPVLHLVIPRTVGHIERYLTNDSDKRRRVHATLAILAQLRGDLGKAFDEDTPKAADAAKLVVEWLVNTTADVSNDWPLPSIGSVKSAVHFQTQMSQASTASPAPERNKRPLDDDNTDPAKRMRLTPQPEGDSGSIVCNEHEITHVSDSMSGTAEGEARLRRQLAGVEEALEHERSHGRAAAEEFHEKETDWDKRQTKFEDLEREYRLLLGRMKVTEEQLETANKNKETLQERLTARTLELREVNEQLEAQRKTDSLSEDEKIKEITRLRSELAAAQEEAKRAVNNKQSVESTFEYQKEQFRIAQDAASAAQSSVDELSKENAKLQHQASGEPARLKALHLDRLYEQQARQIKRLKAETTVLKHTVKQKDEELARVKNTGRTGYGTRAQSATPQPPKIRSRAGSPMGGRLSNLRKE